MNRENIGRQFLVTKFNCAECGTSLNLSYRPRGEKTKQGYEDTTSDGFTGASKVENAIFIEPCPKCVKEALQDMEDLKRIFNKHGVGKDK